MKIRIQLKDPDTMHDAVEDAVKCDLKALTVLSADERGIVAEARAEAIREELGRWFEYGEYLVVEYDTETKTLVTVETGK